VNGDVLSDVLDAVRLRGAVFFTVEATAPWVALSPAAQEVARFMPGSDHVMEFHLLVEGEVWASLVDGEPELARAGDVLIYPQGDAHAFRSARDLALPPPFVPPEEAPSLPIMVRLGNGAPDARFICGYLGCDARPFNPLLSALPRMLRVPAKDGGDPVGEFMRIAAAAAETEAARWGSGAIRARMAEMLFVAAVRRHLDTLPEGATGWLGGLRDPHVGRALGLLHARPAADWTLEALAREVGLSRTVLHERFAALVGQPPMHYLALWRMQVAASRLARGSEKIAAIALEVGYDSEAAFNRAFKRLVGVPPATWRRERGSRAPG
jgi:AraC-like DNA-binding protein